MLAAPDRFSGSFKECFDPLQNSFPTLKKAGCRTAILYFGIFWESKNSAFRFTDFTSRQIYLFTKDLCSIQGESMSEIIDQNGNNPCYYWFQASERPQIFE